jgi:hypothetical protein
MPSLTERTRRGGAWPTRRARGATAVRRHLKLFVLALAAAAFAGPLAAQSSAIEYTIKAAYLFKFTPFIEWPTSAFPAPSSPFYVCVLGGDPFGASLDQAWSGRQVDGHPVKVRRIQALDGNGECHILYIGASRAQAAAAALSKVRGTPVLTVTEQSSGVPGGVVQFVVKDGHVRFTIDADAAAANRMVISAKLLSLAASVKAGS